jgi:hypothetical protein
MSFESGFRKMANMARPKDADNAAAKIVLDSLEGQQYSEPEQTEKEHGERVYATDMDRGNYKEGMRLLESGNLSPEVRQNLEGALRHMRENLSFDKPGAMDYELLADAEGAVRDAKGYLDQRS